jgi:hypothetical protein
MQNAERILGFSFLVILFIVVISMSARGFASYRATLGNSEFNYRFDRSRIGLCLLAVGVSALLSFGYGLLVAKELRLAAGFSLLTTSVVAIGCLTNICYVPKK